MIAAARFFYILTSVRFQRNLPAEDAEARKIKNKKMILVDFSL